MEKYSKAVSEMYSQFKQREAHPLEKYIGRLTYFRGEKLEVVGYSTLPDGNHCLIVDCSKTRGWNNLRTCDVIFKKCEGYLYASIDDLID